MRIPMFWLKAALLLSVVNLPAYGMFKKPHNPFEKEIPQSKQIALYKPQQQLKQTPKPPQGPRLTQRSFNDLPEYIQIQVADYLNYDDQFRLAQTNRQQLFLWGSVSRVPEHVPIITSTPEITRFNWDDSVWPENAHQTIIIQVGRSIKDRAEVRQLERLRDLNNIIHLHFEGTHRTGLMIDITRLLQDNELSQRFQNLHTLAFQDVRPEFHVVGTGLPNLENFLVNGRALRADTQSLGARALFFFRSQLQYLSLMKSELQPATIQEILFNANDENFSALRHIEIVDSTLPEGLTNRRAGIDFRLLPWVNEENILRFHFKSSRRQPLFIPGLSRLIFLNIQVADGQNHRLSWNRFLMFLSPRFIGANQLINVLRVRSVSTRLERLRNLIGAEGPRNENDITILRLPVRLDAHFRNFLVERPFLIRREERKNNKNRGDTLPQISNNQYSQLEITREPLRQEVTRFRFSSILQTTTDTPQLRTRTIRQQKNVIIRSMKKPGIWRK